MAPSLSLRHECSWAEETLSPTNVHSGNPVADRQAVPFNPHALCWRDNRLTGVVHLNLHFWAFISFNWACREIRRRAFCGDVKLPSRQSPNTSMTDKPGDNRPCSSQNANSMNRRLRSPLNHPSFSCPRVPLSTPHIVTCKPRHHTRWPGRYKIFREVNKLCSWFFFSTNLFVK